MLVFPSSSSFPFCLFFSAFFFFLFLLRPIYSDTVYEYKPTWKSLESRPLPKWYDEAKVGIFIHWGVYSVPSYDEEAAEWFWHNWKIAKRASVVKYMEQNYPPHWEYSKFASSFKGDLFYPNEWAKLFLNAGVRYIVLTSKHHEGFCMWKSPRSWNWNSVDNGPQRDIIGELRSAIKSVAPEIHFGLYHSLYEWFNPLYLEDKRNNFTTQKYVNAKPIPDLKEIVEKYKPDIIWSDGDEEAESEYWQSQQFLAWLYNESPVKNTVVTNDRWGKGTICNHGGFLTCSDRYNPRKIQKRKWENCLTLDLNSWGYRRNAKVDDYMAIEELLEQLITTVANGGNILINIGPMADGTIPPICQERLLQLGAWLKINGEAIYETKPMIIEEQGGGGVEEEEDLFWYTKKNEMIFVFFMHWPKNYELNLRNLGKNNLIRKNQIQILMLGVEEELKTEVVKKEDKVENIIVSLPQRPSPLLLSQHAWTLKITKRKEEEKKEEDVMKVRRDVAIDM